jgi:hypothetical protein
MAEIDPRDLEEAWPRLVARLHELQAHLSPEEARVFGEIIRAAVPDAEGFGEAELPRDLIADLPNQPQNDRATRLIRQGVWQLPGRLGLGGP